MSHLQLPFVTAHFAKNQILIPRLNGRFHPTKGLKPYKFQPSVSIGDGRNQSLRFAEPYLFDPYHLTSGLQRCWAFVQRLQRIYLGTIQVSTRKKSQKIMKGNQAQFVADPGCTLWAHSFEIGQIIKQRMFRHTKRNRSTAFGRPLEGRQHMKYVFHDIIRIWLQRIRIRRSPKIERSPQIMPN